MRFVEPVADFSGFIQWFNTIKRDNADKFIFFENHEHFGIAALMQHHITLHRFFACPLHFEQTAASLATAVTEVLFYRLTDKEV